MEVWKPIPNFEGLYEVSSTGRIRSLPRKSVCGRNSIKGRMLKPTTTREGYQTVNLRKNNKPTTTRVHRLVALAHIHTDNTNLEVNHKNGVKSDNCVDNLEWATRIHNQRHALDTGLHKPFFRFREYADEKILTTATYIMSGFSNEKTAKLTGLSVGYISAIRNGKYHSSLTGFYYNKFSVPPKTRKLSSIDVKEILKLYSAGNISQSKIAKMYNTSQSIISLVVMGTYFMHRRDQNLNRKK